MPPPPLSLALLATLLMVGALVSLSPASAEADPITECIAPLGMEENRIPDSAISASSSYEEKSVGPQNARINQERNGGAWCPKAQISGEVREFLEVDLARAHRVSATLTQGRFGNGQGQEYAEAFLLEYWREALGRWALYRDSRGRKVLAGNVNTYLVAKQPLELPFIATRVRFIPFSEHPRTVCMRVELLGCPWDQGLVSYTAPQADEWGAGADARALQDLSYDGSAEGGLLRGGLGQLTDGRFGSAAFLALDPAAAAPDLRWVGWRNDTRPAASDDALGADFGVSSDGVPVSVVTLDGGGGGRGRGSGVRVGGGVTALELQFQFVSAREFSALRLCVCSAPSRHVQVFAEARVYFSADGRRFGGPPLRWSPPLPPPHAPPTTPPPLVPPPFRAAPDPATTVVNVSVALHGRVGRFVKLRLLFASRWILLSEVSFDSVALPRNLSEDALEVLLQRQHEAAAADAAAEEAAGAEGGGAESHSAGSGGGNSAAGESTHARKEITPATSASSDHQAYIGLITGVLAMVVLLLAATVVVMVRRGRKKVALLHKHTALVSAAKPSAAINMKELKLNMALSTPVISAGLARTRTLPKGCKVAAATTGGAGSPGGVGVGGGENVGVGASPAPVAPSVPAAFGRTTGEESEDSETSSVYHEPYKLLPSTKQEYGCLLKKDTLSSSKSGEYTEGDVHVCADFTSVNSFQDEVKFSSSFYKLTPPPPPSARPPPYDKHAFTPTHAPPENYYAATDIVKTERREQHLAAGAFTPLRVPDGSPPAPPPDFPRHRLRLLERLGEGSAGAVHLCEADAAELGTGGASRRQRLLVKSLRRGCSDATRAEFLREAGWLCGLRDANVARVLAVCATEEPLCALQETAELGDLPRFLQQSAAAAVEGAPALSYGCLIYLATQVASGMKYLESMDLVHRDLAARNCAVGKSYSLKITDHAMFCSRFEGDYYVSDTQSRLPVRWMAWESLLLGQYDAKSDVWAFAVTLWEILTLCAQRPFAELSNEQVVENCSRWLRADGQQRRLPRPPTCPREIFDLMGECWRRDAPDRPRFAEIHLFLQRKNLGYVPASG